MLNFKNFLVKYKDWKKILEKVSHNIMLLQKKGRNKMNELEKEIMIIKELNISKRICLKIKKCEYRGISFREINYKRDICKSYPQLCELNEVMIEV